MNELMNIGGFEIANLQELKSLCETVSKSGLVPKIYIGKPDDIFVAALYGNQLGLGLFPALNGIAVINGRPCMWGDALLALARSHPDFLDIQEDFDEQTKTATCIVKRKGQSDTIKTFSLADAKLAGLAGKQGPWTQYPSRMCQLRARGFALRDAFADKLCGLISAEEAQDYRVEHDVTPAETTTNRLKSKILGNSPAYAPFVGDEEIVLAEEPLKQDVAKKISPLQITKRCDKSYADGYIDGNFLEKVLAFYGLENVNQLTQEQMQKILLKLDEKEAAICGESLTDESTIPEEEEK